MSINLRTLKLYLQRGVVPRPPFRSSATRYERRQLIHLLAVRRFRDEQGLELGEMKTRMNAMTAAELEAFATENIVAGPVAAALGLDVGPPAEGAPASAPIPQTAHRRWTHLEIGVGLELLVRDDAGPRELDLARRIYRMCVLGKDETD